MAGHGLRPTPLRQFASRPQLKRDPLGRLAAPGILGPAVSSILAIKPPAGVLICIR